MAGITVRIDPDVLIDEVRIGPNCEHWLLVTVKAALKQWNLGHKITMQSAISAVPL